ncbi:MAG: DNA repair protein RecN [Streptococcaceae bacterium]|jgi:DNA repair protein RecN (Recombination protein N)|nr:DNA repair protein RecN [Streptococcaceae bacterium]
MLQEITIKNFAIIEEVTLSFDAGMTILTGETGAGQSIIIDAMMLLLGGRGSSDFVRHESEKAEIEGLFFAAETDAFLSALTDAELDVSAADGLILRREIFANGRSVCRINGQMVPLGTMRTISEFLIDIHGQHDNQELMNAKRHLALLDAFGDADFESARGAYRTLFEDFRVLRHKLVTRQKNEQEFAQRIEILDYQIDEIEGAGIDLDADEALVERRDQLIHVKEIADALNLAYQALDGDDDEAETGLGLVQTASAQVESVSEFGASYKKWADKLADAYYQLEDVAGSLEDALSDLEFNPSELTQIEERLLQLSTLKKKYGPELTDVLTTLDGAKADLEQLTGNSGNLDTLSADVKEKQAELIAAATVLQEKRALLATALEADIKRELADLYMEKADFKVDFTLGKFTPAGNQQVEFYIQTNPGEGFKPLAKTASGGELSRLMLAIKSSFARKENKTAIVFDEVDTGVSGRVAQAIAEKIYKIAQSGQVLAISHLPQVVAIADTQFYIEKSSADNVTTSTVRKLALSERVTEIAKMLAGDELTPEALAQAEKLLTK